MKQMIKQGFTLIELLVVIAIVGILSGLIIATMSGSTESARIAKLKVYSNSVRDTLGANLVSEWKLDENNNPSANKTPDSWGANTGTLGDGSTTTTFPTLSLESVCASGKCFSFDGSDYVIAASSDTLNPLLGNFSICAWIYPRSIPSTFGTIAQKGNNWNAANGYLFVIGSSDDRYIMLGDGTSYYAAEALTTPGAYNKWEYICTTIDRATSVKIYVNGINQVITVETNTTWSSMGTISPANPFYIGSRFASGYWFDGLIDDVRIYNTAISTSQIQQNYLAGLNKLLANNGITKQEYANRIVDLNKNIAEK